MLMHNATVRFPPVPHPQVRALFAVAAHVAPSVIFIDEVDSLLSARKSDGAWLFLLAGA